MASPVSADPEGLLPSWLFDLFRPAPPASGVASDSAGKKVGIEVEVATLDAATGRAVPYEAEAAMGVKALVEAAAAGGIGALIAHDGLVALEFGDGARVTLEHGGALEYSSAPAPSVVAVARRTLAALRSLDRIARESGLALVGGGNLPFNTAEDIPWMPKPRGRLMRAHYGRLGQRGWGGPWTMALTLSVQTTLDYRSEAEMTEMVRVALLLVPVIVALFANSPLQEGRPSGQLSSRMHYWRWSDPDRTGPIPPALNSGGMGLSDFVDWAIDRPLIYRPAGPGEDGPVPVGRPFRTLLGAESGDAPGPGPRDWRAHLSQIHTDVRLRERIESMQAMRQHGISSVLTDDGHFTQEGFSTLLWPSGDDYSPSPAPSWRRWRAPALFAPDRRDAPLGHPGRFCGTCLHAIGQRKGATQTGGSPPSFLRSSALQPVPRSLQYQHHRFL